MLTERWSLEGALVWPLNDFPDYSLSYVLCLLIELNRVEEIFPSSWFS